MLLSASLKYGLTAGSYKSDRITLEQLGQEIVEPRSEEDRRQALVEAALRPDTLRQIYEYYKGKKFPESIFFQNAIVREFGVPREHAARCGEIFLQNMEFVSLVRAASTGRWLSTMLSGSSRAIIPDTVLDEEDDSDTQANTNAQEDGHGYNRPIEHSLAQRNHGSGIFVGHGKNHRPLEQLKDVLVQYKIPFKIAVEEANRGRPISQKVAETMKECAAAILIFTADEEFRSVDGETLWRPSENVVYELGASSVLYGGKIIVFKEDGVAFPSNFRDIGYISFKKDDLSAKTNDLFRELIAFDLIRVAVTA